MSAALPLGADDRLHAAHLPADEANLDAVRVGGRLGEKLRHHPAREPARGLVLLLHDVYGQAGANLGAGRGHELSIIGGMNNATRISATLPSDLAAFLNKYQETHNLGSRSAALADAVRALRDRTLQDAYRELGEAQQSGRETYPADNLDGLENG